MKTRHSAKQAVVAMMDTTLLKIPTNAVAVARAARPVLGPVTPSDYPAATVSTLARVVYVLSVHRLSTTMAQNAAYDMMNAQAAAASLSASLEKTLKNYLTMPEFVNISHVWMGLTEMVIVDYRVTSHDQNVQMLRA